MGKCFVSSGSVAELEGKVKVPLRVVYTTLQQLYTFMY
jgi:hypothetical protein